MQQFFTFIAQIMHPRSHIKKGQRGIQTGILPYQIVDLHYICFWKALICI